MNDDPTNAVASPKADRHKTLLVQVWVPPAIHAEIQRRCELEKRNVSNFLNWWLEETFARNPMKRRRSL